MPCGVKRKTEKYHIPVVRAIEAVLEANPAIESLRL